MSDDRGKSLDPSTPPGSAGSVSPDIVERWLQTQNRQIDAQVRASELQCQQDTHAFEFGKLALAAQKDDRVHERENNRKAQRDRLVFLLLIAVLVGAIIITAICLNKEQIAMELVKAVIYIAAGAAGGYGYAKTKAAKREPDLQQQVEAESEG